MVERSEPERRRSPEWSTCRPRWRGSGRRRPSARDLARGRTFDSGGARVTRITLQDFAVQDSRTNQFANNKEAEQGGNRFVVRETIAVRSTAPERVRAASQQLATLVQRGVVLSSGDGGGGSGPTYLFKPLSALKPAMIAEATARAREAAEQFARDSKSTLGGIRSASQGAVEILPRDQAPGISEESQLMKIVRVVTTVDYAVRD